MRTVRVTSVINVIVRSFLKVTLNNYASYITHLNSSILKISKYSLSGCLSVSVSVSLSLPVCLSLSVCLSVCLSVSLNSFPSNLYANHHFLTTLEKKVLCVQTNHFNHFHPLKSLELKLLVCLILPK